LLRLLINLVICWCARSHNIYFVSWCHFITSLIIYRAFVGVDPPKLVTNRTTDYGAANDFVTAPKMLIPPLPANDCFMQCNHGCISTFVLFVTHKTVRS